MTDGVIRKFATDVDEPVLVEPRKRFPRPLHGSAQGEATRSS